MMDSKSYARRVGLLAASLLSGSMAITVESAWAVSGFVLGAEIAQSERDLSIGRFEETSVDSQALAGFLGISLENSTFYINYRAEDAEFADGALPYEREEIGIEWHWNDETVNRHFVSASFGFFTTSYSIGTGVNEDFIGFSVGVGGTKDLGRRAFLTGAFKLKLPYTTDEKFLKEKEESHVFFGYETRAALGLYFDPDRIFALQVGYRLQQIDFEGQFVDDDLIGPYIMMRVAFH